MIPQTDFSFQFGSFFLLSSSYLYESYVTLTFKILLLLLCDLI